ncbi:hypothetical protein [Pseudomonas sp. HMWF006]|uniref:hypothetical protein n=1 Tax=Pseudomonas sp. HMWF006 TaxID=2056843 RepID=UPI000D4DC7A9|nr:hypothetical protein [Pseudomonas sp. HMWF006]PTT02040.1 hypothetical protein DBR24_07600 [Pseudomonas sp. HMWF006]
MTSIKTAASESLVGILAAPTPELPDGRDTGKNLIPFGAIPAGRDLGLIIATNTWDVGHDRDTVAVQVTRTQPPPIPSDSDFDTLPRVPLGPAANRPIIFPVSVPARYLGEDATSAGPTPIWVRIALYQGNLNQLSSTVMQFFIDRTAPWQAKPSQTGAIPGTTPGTKGIPLVTFPNAANPALTIDDAWAAANPNGLKVAINTTYPNHLATDRLTLYAAETRTEPPSVNPVHDAAIPLSGEVEIPLATLRAVTTGRVQIWFKLTDLADNVSAWSASFRNVQFLPLPVLAPPIVPFAVDDNLIDLDDVRSANGVTVVVNRPLNTLPTDQLSLTWGGQAAQDLTFGTNTSLTFTIPWSKLGDEYFTNQSGTNYVVPVTVRADLMRGGRSISNASISVDTDYSVVGNPYPIDPTNPPDEDNPLLKPLVVRGQPPAEDNKLGPQDANETATIFIDLSPTDGGTWPDPEPGDLVTVRYLGDAGEVVVTSESLTIANVNTIIELDLPYSIVGPGGLGTKQIWWELENPNRNNLQKAVKTTLEVNTVVIVLDAPEFVRPLEDAGTDEDYIICKSLTKTAANRLARFYIPKNDHLVDGVDVTFNWRGFRKSDYTVPAPAETEFTSTRTVTPQEETGGMYFDVGPYDPVVRSLPLPPSPPHDQDEYKAYVKVWYSTSVVPTSVVTEMTVYLYNGDYLYCESEAGWFPSP